MEDSCLGRDTTVAIIVKHFNQLEQNRRYIRRLGEGGVLGRADTRAYRAGTIFATELSKESLSDCDIDISSFRISMIEPNCIDFLGNELIATGGSELLLVDWTKSRNTVFRDPWYGQLHHAVYSFDEDRILVVATGFDSIFEIQRSTGAKLWHWCAWDNGFSKSLEGHFVVRSNYHTADLNQNTLVVEDPPLKYTSGGKPFGLPARLQSCHINCAVYDEGNILALLFHQGKIVKIDRTTGSAELCLSGLLNPHCLFRHEDEGYMVTDTRRGRALFLDRSFRIERIMNFSSLGGITPARLAATEWLQSVEKLSSSLYIASDTHRSSIHIIDPKRRRRRTVAVPNHWAVHRIIKMPNALVEPIPIILHLDLTSKQDAPITK